jgi:predicted CopG family antitoxin
MAVKTITIDLDAYEALARRKQPGQSFSDVIKQHFHSRSTGRDVLEAVRRFAVSEDTVNAVAAEIGARRRSRARATQW